MALAHAELRVRPEATDRHRGAVPSRVAVVSAVPALFDPAIGLRREPTRPIAFRGRKFDQEFDGETLFYDTVFSPTGAHVIALGPPFLNLRPLAERMRIVAMPAATACRFTVREMDRHAQVWIEVPAGTTQLAIASVFGSYAITPRPSHTSLFAGARVLLTQSKNNRLEWISDWIRYHRDIHGADAVLLYDNGSTRYDATAIARAIRGIAGIKAAGVVEWPFKFGPQGIEARDFWDSDFCQHGVLEHAHWCFLDKAASVMGADVDELLVSRAGESVFAAAERSPFGIIRYCGAWMPGIDGMSPPATPAQPLRHRDFRHVLQPRRMRGFGPFAAYEDRCPRKWTVVPRRCPPGAQWGIHSVKRWVSALPVTDRFSYRHFREINDGWKYDRSGRAAFDPARHVVDEALARNLARVRWDM